MSDIGKGIHRYLMGKASVTRIVGARGFPDYLPQNEELPAYVYAADGGQPEYHMGGQSDLRSGDVTIIAIAETREKSVALSSAIINVLSGFRGAAGDETVRRCHLSDEPVTSDVAIDGSDSRRWETELRFSIHYKTGVPTLT